MCPSSEFPDCYGFLTPPVVCDVVPVRLVISHQSRCHVVSRLSSVVVAPWEVNCEKKSRASTLSARLLLLRVSASIAQASFMRASFAKVHREQRRHTRRSAFGVVAAQEAAPHYLSAAAVAAIRGGINDRLRRHLLLLRRGGGASAAAGVRHPRLLRKLEAGGQRERLQLLRAAGGKGGKSILRSRLRRLRCRQVR